MQDIFYAAQQRNRYTVVTMAYKDRVEVIFNLVVLR